MKYDILSYYDMPHNLITKVNKYLADGWQCQGELIVTNLNGSRLVYTQVMCKAAPK